MFALGALAHGQEVEDAAPGPALPGAFEIQIDAPKDIAALLERHLELQRYRVLPDLSDAEIQSLMRNAQQDAGDLVATLGYFSPEILIRLQAPDAATGGAKAVHIEVTPGPQTLVGAVHLGFVGAIAQDAASQVFGLQEAPVALWIRWPGGREQTVAVKDQEWSVRVVF